MSRRGVGRSLATGSRNKHAGRATAHTQARRGHQLLCLLFALNPYVPWVSHINGVARDRESAMADGQELGPSVWCALVVRGRRVLLSGL